MVDVLSIINALRAPKLHTLTIGELEIDHWTISAGNNSVTVRCRSVGSEQQMLLKCYFRPKRNVHVIYGSAFKRRELGVHTLGGYMEYIDVVFKPWVEGRSLDTYLGDASADYASLSREFDAMAYNLLDGVMAHGDIKPDNIIVREDGTMELIDWDGAWLPELQYVVGDEVGTMSYRHPQRCGKDYDRSIDDYPIALISTTLAVLAADRASFEPRLSPDKSLFEPQLIACNADENLHDAIRHLYELRDVAHYRIANALYSPFISLYGLRSFLEATRCPLPKSVPRDVELRRSGLYWGCADASGWVIPPLANSIAIDGDCCVLSLDDGDIELPVR